MKESLRKNISIFKNIRCFNCGEYLVTRCSHQGAHVCVCKKYIKIADKYIKILLINIARKQSSFVVHTDAELSGWFAEST